jgi:HTH-type transcriptional regulator/antitoxin HigA
MNIRPIKSEADYDAVLAEIERLWGAEPNTAKGDKLDVLLMLVDAYEKEHYPVDPPDPVEAIKFRMEQMGLTRKDLEAYIGSRGRVSEVLSHKRELSLKMIRQLHHNLNIPLESLIGSSTKHITNQSSGPR